MIMVNLVFGTHVMHTQKTIHSLGLERERWLVTDSVERETYSEGGGGQNNCPSNDMWTEREACALLSGESGVVLIRKFQESCCCHLKRQDQFMIAESCFGKVPFLVLFSLSPTNRIKEAVL